MTDDLIEPSLDAFRVVTHILVICGEAHASIQQNIVVEVGLPINLLDSAGQLRIEYLVPGGGILLYKELQYFPNSLVDELRKWYSFCQILQFCRPIGNISIQVQVEIHTLPSISNLQLFVVDFACCKFLILSFCQVHVEIPQSSHHISRKLFHSHWER